MVNSTVTSFLVLVNVPIILHTVYPKTMPTDTMRVYEPSYRWSARETFYTLTTQRFIMSAMFFQLCSALRAESIYVLL